jgi:protein-S-isoprenylcysteine O-methyltransferase Ste14
MKSPRLSAQGFTNLHRKLLFRIMAVALVAYLFLAPDPWKLSAFAALSLQTAGTLLIFAGILGRGLATLSIGGHKDKTIMKTELYSICRNPLYFASFLMALGFGLLSARLDFTLLACAAYLVIFYPMMRNEAAYLRGNFNDFAEYEKQVPLFFPNLRLWQERKHIQIDFRLVRKTLQDASLVLPLIPLMILVRAYIAAK